MSSVTVEGNEITAQAGALLSAVAAAAKNASLTGFEFAGGIPGTIGGAVVMNAGAYGGEMKDVLTEVTVMNAEGDIFTLPTEELELGYRTSIIKTAGYIVLEAKIDRILLVILDDNDALLSTCCLEDRFQTENNIISKLKENLMVCC